VSFHLLQLQTAVERERRHVGGRTVIRVEATQRSIILASALVAGEGPSHPRVDASGYRSTVAREFDIDSIVIRPENDLDRWGKRVGLNTEAELGEPAIDDAFYMETRTPPDVVRDLLGEPAVCAALVAALERFLVVIIGPPGGVVACMRPGAPVSFDDPRDVDALLALAGALPAFRVRAPPWPHWRSVVSVVAIFGFSGLIAAARAAASSSLGLVATPVVIPGLAGLAVGLALAATPIRSACKGRSDGLRRWLVASIATVMSWTLLAPAAFGLANRFLDAQPGRDVEANVVRYRPPGKHTSGELLVSGLPHDIARGDLAVDPDWMVAYGCIRLAFRLHAGRFGLPWVERARCTKSSLGPLAPP
jgi:hypothetical protein